MLWRYRHAGIPHGDARTIAVLPRGADQQFPRPIVHLPVGHVSVIRLTFGVALRSIKASMTRLFWRQ
jgi:hypothetical protein